MSKTDRVTCKVATAGVTWDEVETQRINGKNVEVHVQNMGLFGQIVEMPESEFERLAEDDYVVPEDAEIVISSSYSTPMTTPAPQQGESGRIEDVSGGGGHPADDPDETAGNGGTENDKGTAPTEPTAITGETSVEDVMKVIEDGKLNAEATVALAGGDQEVAKLVLAAEVNVADRKTVVEPLQEIIDGPAAQ